MWVAQWPGGSEGFDTEAAAETFAEGKLPSLPLAGRYVVVYELTEGDA